MLILNVFQCNQFILIVCMYLFVNFIKQFFSKLFHGPSSTSLWPPLGVLEIKHEHVLSSIIHLNTIFVVQKTSYVIYIFIHLNTIFVLQKTSYVIHIF